MQLRAEPISFPTGDGVRGLQPPDAVYSRSSAYAAIASRRYSAMRGCSAS